MDSGKSAAFRTAVGGFNKKDVNNYIAALSEKNNETIRSYEEQITSLNERIAGLEQQNSAAETSDQEISSLREQLEQANALIAAQNEQLAEKSAALEKSASELDDANRRLSELTARLESLNEAEDKLRDYGYIKSNLGEIMADAASQAEKMKADAADTVQARLRDLEARERELLERQNARADALEAKYQAAVRALNARLDVMAKDGLASLTELLRAAGDEALAAIEKQRAGIGDIVAQTAAALPELQALTADTDTPS
ncbi:MAG: hypothetical protein IJ493_01965 [Clostridia bacterium]|nr:hypothetical protein [Clostridia bacterium]